MESALGRGWGKFKCSPRKRGQGVRRLECSPHVDLIESSQHRTRILGLLQTLSNALPHPIHFLLKAGQVLTAWSLWIRPSLLSPRERSAYKDRTVQTIVMKHQSSRPSLACGGFVPLSENEETQTRTTHSDVPAFDRGWRLRKWFDLKTKTNL